MPSAKRKSTNFLDHKPRKKIKNITSTPCYIKLNGQETVQYFFKTKRDAEWFLKTNIPEWSDPINKIQTLTDQGKSIYVVNFTPDQLNHLFGPKAFDTLAEITRLNKPETIYECANTISQLDPPLANQAALLTYELDGWTGFHIVSDQPYADQFINFLGKLSPEVCNAAALLTDCDGWSGLKSVAENQTSKEFITYLNKLTPETCNKAAHNRDTFVSIASNQKGAGFMAYLAKLTPETCNKIALPEDNHSSELDAVIQNQFGDAVGAFIDKLSPETCETYAASQGPEKSPLATMAVKQRPLEFIAFADKLSDETCNREALRVDASDGHSALLDIALSQYNEAWNRFIDRLSNDTCNKAANMKDKNGLTVVEMITRNYGSSTLINFLRRLDDETRLNALLEPARYSAYGNQTLLIKLTSDWGNGFFNQLIDELSPESCAKIVFDQGENLLSVFSRLIKQSTFFKLFNKVMENPAAAKKVVDEIPHLKSIEFFDGGESKDNWSDIAEILLGKLPEPNERNPIHDLSYKIPNKKYQRPAFPPDFLSLTKNYGLRFVKLLGRSILLQDPQGVMLAVKIQKANEKEADLIQEYDTVRFLRTHKEELNLESDFPTPLSVSQLTGINDWLSTQTTPDEIAKFKKMVGDEAIRSAYIYKVDKHCDYFTYLYDVRLSDEAFERANDRVVNDLFLLLGKGIVFHQLADIFHNLEHQDYREDKGRYIVLANLLVYDEQGTGRLTGWKKAVEFPNLRASGLADMGDRISINDLIRNSKRVKDYYSASWYKHTKCTGNYLLSNVMAEYQYILLLIAGVRGCGLTEKIKQKNLPEKKKKALIDSVWRKLAERVMKNCVLAVSLLTHQSKEEIHALLKTFVNVDQLGKQMQYWMTDEYIADILQNRIRKDIYDENVWVKVDNDHFRAGTFNEESGSAIDGINPDLGFVNGQEPIKQANELFYWMVNTIVNRFQQYRLTLQDLKKVTAANDLNESERLRQSSFTHLPKKSYHAIQLALCNERLRQRKPLPLETRINLEDEVKNHRDNYSALVIQGLWRKRTSPSNPKVCEPKGMKRKRV